MLCKTRHHKVGGVPGGGSRNSHVILLISPLEDDENISRTPTGDFPFGVGVCPEIMRDLKFCPGGGDWESELPVEGEREWSGARY